MKKHTLKRRAIQLVIAVTLVVLFSAIGYKINYGEIFGYNRGVFVSPDGAYQLVVRGRGVNLFPAGFGDAGGVPANVTLIELKSGRKIGRARIEAAYLVFLDGIKWLPDKVNVVDVGHWQLPSGKFDTSWD